MDVAEVALFNNSLAGMNLNGNKFFYVNPLEADGYSPFNHGEPGRSPWFETACCPSNLARMLPQVSGMMYAYTANEIYVSLYASSHTVIPLKQGKVRVHQVSAYPYNGQVILEVTPEKAQRFTIKFRIPTWTGSQFVPGSLYRYCDQYTAGAELAVNGKATPLHMKKGFATVTKTWKPGDMVSLTLPMPVRFSKANVRVEADRNRIAVTKGPLVYCAEGVDNHGAVQRFFIDKLPAPEQITTAKFADGIMDQITTISLPVMASERSGVQAATLTLIPYYSWNNRGNASMIVWLPEHP